MTHRQNADTRSVHFFRSKVNWYLSPEELDMSADNTLEITSKIPDFDFEVIPHLNNSMRGEILKPGVEF